MNVGSFVSFSAYILSAEKKNKFIPSGASPLCCCVADTRTVCFFYESAS